MLVITWKWNENLETKNRRFHLFPNSSFFFLLTQMVDNFRLLPSHGTKSQKPIRREVKLGTQATKWCIIHQKLAWVIQTSSVFGAHVHFSSSDKWNFAIADKSPSISCRKKEARETCIMERDLKRECVLALLPPIRMRVKTSFILFGQWREHQNFPHLISSSSSSLASRDLNGSWEWKRVSLKVIVNHNSDHTRTQT